MTESLGNDRFSRELQILQRCANPPEISGVAKILQSHKISLKHSRVYRTHQILFRSSIQSIPNNAIKHWIIQRIIGNGTWPHGLDNIKRPTLPLMLNTSKMHSSYYSTAAQLCTPDCLLTSSKWYVGQTKELLWISQKQLNTVWKGTIHFRGICALGKWCIRGGKIGSVVGRLVIEAKQMKDLWHTGLIRYSPWTTLCWRSRCLQYKGYWHQGEGCGAESSRADRIGNQMEIPWRRDWGLVDRV